MKPKARLFATKEEKRRFTNEYKKKIKTELCKTYMLKESCRFGDYCSFAHGNEELKEKTHLSSNYKTKPCKQFFFQGQCPYGYRCQYLHKEIKNENERIMQFHDILLQSYSENAVLLNFLTRFHYHYSIKLEKLSNLIKFTDLTDKADFLLDKDTKRRSRPFFVRNFY